MPRCGKPQGRLCYCDDPLNNIPEKKKKSQFDKDQNPCGPPLKDPPVRNWKIRKLECEMDRLETIESNSMLKKYLTRELFDQLKYKQTSYGASLLECVQTGFKNPDSSIGVYAPDPDAYCVFADLFNPIIEEYHQGFRSTDRHPKTDFGEPRCLKDLDPHNCWIISTRVRCARSLKDYPFNPMLTEEQYIQIEKKVACALSQLTCSLKGKYYRLTEMGEENQQRLIDEHFLFNRCDRFMAGAKACRYWPIGRGIFINEKRNFLVWCGEEDHMRIISLEAGGNLRRVYSRMVKGVNSLDALLNFNRDKRLGYLTFCPTNLGNTIRASVHIKLPKLTEDPDRLAAVAEYYNLQVRGTAGEHTETEDGVYDISNKRRLGLTEYQSLLEMQSGIQALIKIERDLTFAE